MKPKVSIIIPLKKIIAWTEEETVPAILNQTYSNFEIIILPDRKTTKKFAKTKVISTWPKLGPADKRDIGVKNASGEIVAFIDDDAFPDKNWLKNAINYFKKDNICAVCGPGLTPDSDSLFSKVSGWMWASWLGSGGAGRYRCWPGKKRIVDDFPTFNLIVRKNDYKKIGGFDSDFWPGEDTKLCHDLVYKLGKKIVYDPKVFVYHHRRDIFLKHLKQAGRYGLHRGYFVKILPKTSKRLGYFGPMIFSLGLIMGPLVWILFKLLNLYFLASLTAFLYLFSIFVYITLLLFSGLWVYFKSKKILEAVLTVPTIFVTHLFYGLMFIKGINKKIVKSKYSRDKI
jgi:glycosyltransferase involved in cell wall biosynthesis